MNKLLDDCRTVVARILSRGPAKHDPTLDGLTLATLFDQLDARIQRLGMMPDAWHPNLKRRSDPPRSMR